MDYSINQLSTYLYLSSLYIIGKNMTVGGCMLNCIMLLSMPCFPTFSCSAIPASCYTFNVLYYILRYTNFTLDMDSIHIQYA